MILVDTHTHLYLSAFDEDRAQVATRAISAGVDFFLLPNIDERTLDSIFDLHQAWPEHMLPMAGLHPTSVRKDFEKQLDHIFSYASGKPVYAVGETGIDLYWDATLEKYQRAAFRRQCEIAISMALPVCIHMRNSYSAIMEELETLGDVPLKGVFHCFSGSRQQAQAIIERGFYLGIGGVVTFKNSKLLHAIKDIPLDKILLETDAPYLAPHPYRGKRNESAYLPLVAKKMAQIHNTTIEKVAEKTTKNAKELFGF